MRVLPQKLDIDRERNIERKKEIDSGIALATRIDKLRETKANEEKALFEWRQHSLKLIQKEIDDYITVRDNLKKQTEEAEVHRKKLIEPLDNEWIEINKVKLEISANKEELYIQKEQFKLEEQKLKNKQNDLSIFVSKNKIKEGETEKIRSETISLKDLAQREYEIAREERRIQTESFEKSISEVDERKKEYEVGLSLIQIRENEVNEKESDIIKREKHLESQQTILRVAKEVLQQK